MMHRPKFPLVLMALMVAGFGGRAVSQSLDADDLTRAIARGGSLDAYMDAPAAGNTGYSGTHQTLDLTKIGAEEALSGLNALTPGSHLEVRIGQRQIYRYVVDTRHESDGTVELRGHLLSDADKSLVLGIKPAGATGFFELPDGRIHALGYADGMQVAGRAGDDWMADRLNPGSLRERAAGPGEAPPTPGATPVDIDLPQLAAMSAGEETLMQMPGIGVVRVTMVRQDISDETTTWVGHLADFGDNYPVLITYSADAIEGNALTPLGEVVLTAGHAYNPQLLGLVNAKRDGDNCAVTAALSAKTGATAEAATSIKTASAAAATPSAPAKTIDVLVYYSPDMEVLYGSASGVATRVDSLFAAANQSYGAASLGYGLRRVGLKKINVSDTLANDQVLSRLQTRAGEFAPATADRNAAGADLVTVIRPMRTAQHRTCGIAYVGGANGSNLSQYAEHMLSVVSDGRDRNGTNTYCDTLTLAHETGHNLGLAHDRATMANQGGGTGVKPYAFGFAKSNTWGTIMSYTSPVQYRFSNPNDKTCPGNTACGVASTASNSADNVLALSYSLPIVAGFRTAAASSSTAPAPASLTVSGTVSLDGKAVAGATLTPSVASVTCSASGSTGRYSCQAPAGSSFTLKPNIAVASGRTVAWTPASASFTNLAANGSANFSGKTTIVNVSLSGQIILNGKPVSGARLTVTGSGASCGSSNTSGIYSCTVTPGSTFTLAPNVTPASGTKITWTPASITYKKLAANASNGHFTGRSSSLTRSISGQVLATAGNKIKPVAGATLTASISGVSCSNTNAAGNFSCTTTLAKAFSLQPSRSLASHTFTWMRVNLPASGNATVKFTGSATCPKTGCKF